MSADGSRSENTVVIKLAVTGAEDTIPRRLSGQMSKKDQALALVWRRSEAGGEVLFIDVKGKDVLVYGSEAWIEGLGGAQTDAPAEATWPCSMDQANALIKKLKDSPSPGPVLFGGKWAGELHLHGAFPEIHLARKIASYGILQVKSTMDGWQPTVVRQKRWFADEKEEQLPRKAYLHDAIQEGIAHLMGMVKDACGIRDTTRRAAMDTGYAELHPIKVSAVRPDPIDRWKPPVEKAPVEKAPKGRAKKEPPPMLAQIPAPEVPACPTSTAKVAEATQAEAQALSTLADTLWGDTEQPELLLRAGKLIRQAQALISSPHCQGQEKDAALAELRKAADAYTKVRNSILEGVEVDTVKSLRRVAEQVALASAKAGKSCAGQYKRKLVTLEPTPQESRPQTAPRPSDDLVVVPLFGTPKTARELQARLNGYVQKFAENQNVGNAKALVKNALTQLGNDAFEAKASKGDQGVVVTVTSAVTQDQQDMVSGLEVTGLQVVFGNTPKAAKAPKTPKAEASPKKSSSSDVANALGQLGALAGIDIEI